MSLLRGYPPVLLGEGVELFSVAVPASLADRTLGDSGIGSRTGLTVIALQHGEQLVAPLASETRLPVGAESSSCWAAPSSAPRSSRRSAGADGGSLRAQQLHRIEAGRASGWRPCRDPGITPVNNVNATPKASGSRGPRPISRLLSTVANPAAIARPISAPTAARTVACRSTSRTTADLRRADGEADRDLALTLRDRERHEAVQAERGEEQTERGDGSRQSRRRAAAAAIRSPSLLPASRYGSPAASDRMRRRPPEIVDARLGGRAAHVERHLRPELLRHRHIDEVARLVADAAVLAVARDADDVQRALLAVAVSCISVRPTALCRQATAGSPSARSDRDERRARAIAVVERPSLHEADPQGSK